METGAVFLQRGEHGLFVPTPRSDLQRSWVTKSAFVKNGGPSHELVAKLPSRKHGTERK